MPQKLKITLNLEDVKATSPEYKKFSEFSKEALIQFLLPLIELKMKYDIELTPASKGPGARAFRMIKNVKQLRTLLKNDLIFLLASYKKEVRNSLALAIDPSIRQLWLRLLDTIYVEKEEVEKILGHSPHVATTGSWRPQASADCLCMGFSMLYRVNYYYYGETDVQRYSFYLKPEARKIAEEYFYGEARISIKTREALPEEESQRIVNFEGDIMDVMDFLYGTYASGKLPGSDGTVATTRISTLVKRMDFADFPVPSSLPMEWPSRKSLIAMAYCMYVNVGKVKPDEEGLDIRKFAKFVAETLAGRIYGTTFTILFPEFMSFTRSWAGSSDADEVAKCIEELLTEGNDANEWVDMSNFIPRYLCSDTGTKTDDPYLQVFNSESRSRSTLSLKGDRGRYDIDWWIAIDRRFLSRWLRVLAACGLLELSLDMNSKTDDELEGIRYVRWTPLGLYAIGKTQTYTAAVNKNMEDIFDVDNTNGIVTIMKAQSPYESFFKEIGRKIGSSRYKIDAVSLVKGCRNKSVLSQQVGRIKYLLQLGTEGAWERIFDEAHERMDIQMPGDARFLLLRLNPNIPGLIQYVASNPEIGKECVKAERGYILVPESFESRFEEILLEGGYRY